MAALGRLGPEAGVAGDRFPWSRGAVWLI